MRSRYITPIIAILTLASVVAYTAPGEQPVKQQNESQETATESATVTQLETATFGGGCFWCTEAVYQQIKGVESVVSGYTGGQVDNPTYKQICTGTTGHAEVIQVKYNPSVVSFAKLLDCLLYTSPSPRDATLSRMPSSA